MSEVEVQEHAKVLMLYASKDRPRKATVRLPNGTDYTVEAPTGSSIAINLSAVIYAVCNEGGGDVR